MRCIANFYVPQLLGGIGGGLPQAGGILKGGLGNRNPPGGYAGGIKVWPRIALGFFAAGGLSVLLVEHQHHHQADGGGGERPFHREPALVGLQGDRFAETLFHGAPTPTAKEVGCCLREPMFEQKELSLYTYVRV